MKGEKYFYKINLHKLRPTVETTSYIQLLCMIMLMSRVPPPIFHQIRNISHDYINTSMI